MPLEPVPIRVVELFAGVGGFRLGLEGHPWASQRQRWPNHGYQVVWANQWEPPGSETRQFAFRCYRQHFGTPSGQSLPPENQDIAKVNAGLAEGTYALPPYDMLVGGFPCQDYSVAKPLPKAAGIEGQKGVLWWQIYERIAQDKPKYVVLENVDRLLKSPASRRGRDFAVILACFAHLDYLVEWRVVNAADYGNPQRRRRVFIFAERLDGLEVSFGDRLFNSGVLANALPIEEKTAFLSDPASVRFQGFELHDDPEALVEHPHFPYFVSEVFGSSGRSNQFHAAGIMQKGRGIHLRVTPDKAGIKMRTLGQVVARTRSVDESFYVSPDALSKWEYLKGSKSEKRVHKGSGFEYHYSEGGMAFPEDLTLPSRTVLTGEGGPSPSRFKHVIREPGTGRLRRLTPEELEVLNGFPRGWTDTSMSPPQRAFCMGNALVVGVVQRIGKALAEHNRALAAG